MNTPICQRIHITYTMRFTSPFHMGTGMRRGLVDRGVARDGAEYLYVPGSTIKGVLRDHCEQIALNPGFRSQFLKHIESPYSPSLRPFARSRTIVERIFGSRMRESTLFFDDALLCDTSDSDLGKNFFYDKKLPWRDRHLKTLQVEVRAQNRISRQTGTAVEQGLFSSEYGLRTLRFAGNISGTLEDWPVEDGGPTHALVLLAAGLRFFDRIGANKSTGMGQCALQVQNEQILVDGAPCRIEELLGFFQHLGHYTEAEEHAGKEAS